LPASLTLSFTGFSQRGGGTAHHSDGCGIAFFESNGETPGNTGKTFLTYKGFHTYGGFLFGRLGLGLGQSTSCWPKDKTQLLNKLNIDQLLKQGEMK